MTYITSRTWSEEDLQKLKEMIANGATPVRCAVVFKRTIATIKVKARTLGMPFPKQKPYADEHTRVRRAPIPSRDGAGHQEPG